MRKILVIEDDPISQDFMRRFLKKDYEVDICDSSEEYYQLYSESKYSVMIVDISIKGSKNGFELIREIRESTTNGNTSIICLTAHAQSHMRHTAFESGADLFMTKPVPNNTLKNAIAFLIMSLGATKI